MRVPGIRASCAETSEVVREQYGLAQDVFKQHWIPITAAAAGLYCLWRFVRFIRQVSTSKTASLPIRCFCSSGRVPHPTSPDMLCKQAQH